MKKLTKEQELARDAEIDWVIAENCCHARDRKVWDDFSPTTDWAEAGRLIEKYQIDIRYFNLETNPTLEHPWMGGLQIVCKRTKILTYFTAFGPTPLIAAMTSLAIALKS